MKLLEFCCGSHIPHKQVGCVFNHPVVMSCLIWAVVILVLCILAYCYLKKKDKNRLKESEAAREHELKMKEEAFKKEKFWAFYKRAEEPLEDELKKVKGELAELKNKERDLNEGQTALKKEKEEQEKIILEEKIKVYQEIIKETK